MATGQDPPIPDVDLTVFSTLLTELSDGPWEKGGRKRSGEREREGKYGEGKGKRAGSKEEGKGP